MQIARIIGSAVSTAKDPKLTGLKLLVAQKATPDNQVYGEPFLVADTVGAGEGELVILVEGQFCPRDAQNHQHAGGCGHYRYSGFH